MHSDRKRPARCWAGTDGPEYSLLHSSVPSAAASLSCRNLGTDHHREASRTKPTMDPDERCSRSSVSPLPLVSLNHISKVCSEVERTASFYRDVLGFMEVKRPESLKFEGRWLFAYAIGIHLIKADSVAEVEKRLQDNDIKYVTAWVTEGGVRVKQVFFKDPDNAMIEICNCNCLPVVPLESNSYTSDSDLSDDILANDDSPRTPPQQAERAPVDARLGTRP